MNYNSKHFAQEKAEEDFREYLKKIGSKTFRLPIQPEHVAEVLWGTDVCFLDEKEMENGKIAQANLEENKIFVGVCGYDPRDRFSTAHEVGHFSVHKYIFDLGELSSNDQTFREYQADAYASALLMPKDLVFNVIQGDGGLLTNDEQRISLIVQKFSVSKQAATIRLMDMNLIRNKRQKKQIDLFEKQTQISRDAWFAELKN